MIVELPLGSLLPQSGGGIRLHEHTAIRGRRSSSTFVRAVRDPMPVGREYGADGFGRLHVAERSDLMICKRQIVQRIEPVDVDGPDTIGVRLTAQHAEEQMLTVW